MNWTAKKLLKSAAKKSFDPDWYAWQNPDWAHAHGDPYIHYHEIGRFQNRDPSPMIDMTRYGAVVGDAIPPKDRLAAIQRGVRSPALGVYESWADLEKAQADFIDAISVVRGRDDRPAPRRANLVFYQAGSQSRHREWFTNAPRSWDLLVNYYDANGYDDEFGDIVFFQAGTKFTAVHNILSRISDLFAEYEYVLFLDDDIGVSMEALDALFAACAHNGLDLAQMALSNQSNCIWEYAFARGRRGLRHLNCVEIMMPVLSRQALELCGHDFVRSVSGFGLDLLFGKKIAKPDYSNVAIIDDIVVDHLKPIDDSGGGYYSYLRSRLINPKAELWRLITEEGLERTIREVRPVVPA